MPKFPITSPMRAAVLAAIGAVAGLAGFVFAPSDGALKIAVSGPERIIFDSDADGCDAHHLPDAPARAFRDAQGRMVLFAPNFQNRAFVGQNLADLKPDCHSRFRAGDRAVPDLLDDRTWIHALYTNNGRDVFALGSASFIPYRHDMPCKGRTRRTDCWGNGLVTLKSTDGGQNFQYLGQPPHHAPFPPPEPYRDTRKRAPSYVTVTNIVRVDDYLYAIVWRRAESYRDSRNCLVRAPADDPSRWQVWDGDQYIDAARFGPDGWQVQPTECARIGPYGITSIRGFLRFGDENRFIAIYQHRRHGHDGQETHGIFYSTSTDMKHWSMPQLLLSADLKPDAGPGDPFIAYPTMIDDNSPDRLFGTVGETADLVFVRLVPKPYGDKWRVSRQLVRVPVSITP